MGKDQIVSILDDVHAEINQIGWVDEGEKVYFTEQRGRYEFMLRYLEEGIIPGHALLDVGSHVLHFSMAASSLGYLVSGTDVGLFAGLVSNKLRQERYGISEVRECDLSKDTLPYSDQSFDVVNFSETLEHLNFNPLPVVKELHRVLKPGGRVLITTPNALRLGNRVRFLMGHNVFADLNNLCWGDPYSAHYREYSLDEVVQLLEWGGFTILIKKTCYLYPETGIRRLLKETINFFFPSLPGNLFVVGIK